MVAFTKQGNNYWMAEVIIERLVTNYSYEDLEHRASDSKLLDEVRRIENIPTGKRSFEDLFDYYLTRQVYYVKKICKNAADNPPSRKDLQRYARKVRRCGLMIESIKQGFEEEYED